MKYAIVFSLLALTLGWNAWQAESIWQSIAEGWAALSFALVAAAYAANTVRIFGKKSDGRKQLLNSFILMPYLVLAESLWWLNTRLSSEPPWHRIDDHLIVGRRLSAREALPPGITSVLDLTSEFTEARHLRSTGYTCLPMLDASHSDPRSIAAAVRSLASRPGILYIHCAQGHGRTGLLAALILIARNPGLSADDALRQLRAIRPGIGLSKRQGQALESVAALLTAPNQT